MRKPVARAFEKGFLCYGVTLLCVLAAAATVVGNADSLAYAGFSQLLFYVVLPVLAYVGLGVLAALRASALLTVIPAALGCLIAVMLESYLTVLFTNPGSFSMIWLYLNPANLFCMALASVMMTAGCVLYVLCAMGVLKNELFPMIPLGLAAVALLAEYLLTLMDATIPASPWYMISTVLFLMALVLSVVCFEPIRPVPLPKNAIGVLNSRSAEPSEEAPAHKSGEAPEA